MYLRKFAIYCTVARKVIAWIMNVQAHKVLKRYCIAISLSSIVLISFCLFHSPGLQGPSSP